MEKLASLISDTAIGVRARFVLARHFLETEQWVAFDKLFEMGTPWLDDVDTLILKARSLVTRGQLDAAEEIYRPLLESHGEAQVFLARQAYQRKDYATAMALNDSLIERFPEERQFYANRVRIERAMAGGEHE